MMLAMALQCPGIIYLSQMTNKAVIVMQLMSQTCIRCLTICLWVMTSIPYIQDEDSHFRRLSLTSIVVC